MNQINLHSGLRKISSLCYSTGLLFLVVGLGLSLVNQTALASPAYQASSDNYVVFDPVNGESDPGICQLSPGTITTTGTVHLSANYPSATLQLDYYIVNPPDLKTGHSYTYIDNVTDGQTFSLSGFWPGVRPGDTVVEIHFGANLLYPDRNGNVITTSGAGQDFYWKPFVCDPPTPVIPTPTFTATATQVASSTPTRTPTNTPVLETATNTPTPGTPTPGTPTATNTPPPPPPPGASVTPTVAPTDPGTTATPTTVSTLPPPPQATSDNPQPLIPVTGADNSLSGSPLGGLLPRVSLNLGITLLGLGLITRAFSRLRKKDR